MSIPCECGEFFWDNRQRVSPTGSKDFSILVFSCLACGSMQPVYPLRLSWAELDWIRRWNRRAVREYKDRQNRVNDRVNTSTYMWDRMSPTE